MAHEYTVIQVDVPPLPRGTRDPGRGRSSRQSLPPVAVLFLIIWAFAILVIFQLDRIVGGTLPNLPASTSQLIVSDSNGGALVPVVGVGLNNGNLRRGLLALVTALMVCGYLNLWWGMVDLQQWKRSTGFRHFGIAICCTLLAFGIEWVFASRVLTENPIVIELPRSAKKGEKATEGKPAVSESAGDAAKGRKLFAMTCGTCHGPAGDGLSNLAPSLRTSEFIKAGDLAAIKNVITNGRAINDPANKSGKVMPAKGGNPFLKPEQIADLAAFVVSLPNEQTGSQSKTSADSSAAIAKPIATLNRWVVPAAAVPPGGTAWGLSVDPAVRVAFPEPAVEQSLQRGSQQRDFLGIAAVVLHSALLVMLFLVTGRSLFSWLLDLRLTGNRGWLVWAIWGWGLALISWVAIVSTLKL